jgi:hypothetical protein
VGSQPAETTEYMIPCRLSRRWFHRLLLFTNFSISFSVFRLKMDVVCLDFFFISDEKENDGKTLWLDRKLNDCTSGPLTLYLVEGPC